MDDSDSKPGHLSTKAIREELSKIEADQIMIPRSEVTILNANLSFKEIIDIIIKDGHSRFPVFAERIDNVLGVLYVKDLLPFFRSNDCSAEFDIKGILRKPLIVPENKRAGELLSEFRINHVHIAIVVNEFGGFLGIITLEDILEEIVGEISDEFEKEETSNYIVISKKETVIYPKMTIGEFNKLFRTRIKSDDFDTIGGFVLDQFGHVPHKEESITYRNLILTIKKVEGSKIQQIMVTRK